MRTSFRIGVQFLFVLSCVALGMGCGGQSHSNVIPASGASSKTSGPMTQANAQVQITVQIPAKITTMARRVLYVSPSTSSMQVVVVPVGGGASSAVVSNCSGMTCSATVGAAFGANQFTVSLFDAQNATGNLLSTGTVIQQIQPAKVNQVTISLNPVVASVVLTVTPPVLPASSGGSFTISATALDIDRNPIIGPYPPILVTPNNPSVHLTQPTISQSGQTVSGTFSGGSPGLLTFSAQVAGISTTSVTPATLVLYGPNGPNGFGLLASSTSVGISGAHIGSGGPIPSATTLTAQMPPVPPPALSQGSEQSCVGWATAYALNGYYQGIINNWQLTTTNGSFNYYYNFSPSFVYNQINGGVDHGSSIADAFMKVLSTEGADTWIEMPYTTNVALLPTPAQIAAAKPYVMPLVQMAPTPFPYGIEAEIAQGNPVVVGIEVDSTFLNLQPGQIWNTFTTPVGAHAVVLVGYDTTKDPPNGAFLLQNSWGTSWGGSEPVGPGGTGDGRAWADADNLVSHLVNGNEAYIAPYAGTTTPAPIPSGTIAGVFEYYAIPNPGGGEPQGIVTGPNAGPNGTLWFAEYDGSVASVTTSLTPVVSVNVPPLPRAITLGHDGNLWFTEAGVGAIGMVTPLGVATAFPIPNPIGTGSRPYGITSDLNGHLWFVGNSSQYIGELTTSGTFIGHYKVPTNNPGLQNITLGSDGALWFTEAAKNKIGRITTAGVVTNEWALPSPLPTGGAFLGGIVNGPDNNIWFTALGVPAIGTLTMPSGPITLYQLPTLPNSATEGGGITVGPDKALWFTEPAEGAVGRITTSGTGYQTFQPDLPIKPLYITQGPDGAIWFTDAYGLIWRLH